MGSKGAWVMKRRRKYEAKEEEFQLRNLFPQKTDKNTVSCDRLAEHTRNLIE